MFTSFTDFIPTLINSSHKGDMGRIAIIGGSREYTGAPFFSGLSALYCGADLVHIICANEAASVIKTYSPDLIVHPDLDNNLTECIQLIDRMHAVVIGPGLGRAGNVENTREILVHCSTTQKPLVIDADGLYIVTQQPDLLIGLEHVILTPNVVEFKRLYHAVFSRLPSDRMEETQELAKALGTGVTIIRKGSTDVVSNGETATECTEPGSPRRCGGQGDLLSGTTAVFLNWFRNSTLHKAPLPFPVGVGAAMAACLLTRRCSNLAFRKYGRSMVTANMLPEIHTAFEQLFGRA